MSVFEMERPEQDEEFGSKVFEQFMELFVTPEVKRRQDVGRLEKPLDLRAAQIVFFPDNRKNQVRINSEVKGYAEFNLKPGISKEDHEAVFEHELESMHFIELDDEDDPDCGHATLFRLGNRWSISFDFRYNKALSKKHIETAKQFYDAAQYSLEHKSWSAFIDNLFSAAELLARSVLLSHSEAEFREKTTHKTIKSRYNQWFKLGNLDASHRQAFNTLSNLRGGARYLTGDSEMAESEAQELLHTVGDMMEDALRRAS